MSRDVSLFPNAECLYLVIDVKLLESEDGTPNTSEDEQDDQDDDGDDQMTEIRFVPADPASLDGLFQSMKMAQALHPDPADDSPDSEAGDEDEGDEEEGDGNGEGEEGMYDDAEEEQEEGGAGDKGDGGNGHQEEEAMEEA